MTTTDANEVPPMPPDDGALDEPIPLTDPAPLPPFPVDALPAPAVADMVNAVAEATQTDPAMAGTSALSALSACSGGHAEIEIRPGWREPLCAYTAIVADPGERKSAVQQAMTAPLLDAEQGLVETAMPAHLESKARKQIADKAAEQATRDAAKADNDTIDERTADAIGAAAKAASIDVPPIPRLIADDITPEKVASVLAEQKGRLAIVSAEGGIFDIIAGRYNGNVPNLDVWLKGHSGDPIRIDRMGREPDYIRRPALTVALMIQPEVLKVIAGHRVFRGRGLLARFLYAMPVSKVGHRQAAAKPVPADVENAYSTLVRELASGMAEWLSDPAILVLTDKAQEAIAAIEEAVEPTLDDDGELAALKDWGAKYVGAIARIAGMLHLAELGAEHGPITPVTAETILKAQRIGAYFRAAAINAFIQMGTDQAIADAAYLLRRIEKIAGDGDELSERDMHQACRSRFRKKDALVVAVGVLVDHGYLIPQQTNQATGGRPPSPRYKVRL
jgi:replicative DNA helicase